MFYFNLRDAFIFTPLPIEISTEIMEFIFILFVANLSKYNLSSFTAIQNYLYFRNAFRPPYQLH